MIVPSQRVEGWLEDIIGWGERIDRHIAGKDFSFFAQHELTQDAVMKCIDNIGEAAGNILRLEPDFERLHPQLALSSAYRARNRIAHGYDTINLSVVWLTACESVPEIVVAAQEALRSRRAVR